MEVVVGSDAIVGELPDDIAVRGKVSSDVPATSVFSAVSTKDSIAPPSTVPSYTVVISAVPYAVRGETIVGSVPCVVTPYTDTGQVGTLETYSNFFVSMGLPRIFAVPTTGGDAGDPCPVTIDTPLVPIVALRVIPPLGSSKL